jgi:peptidoglycan hydrolase CwlO-like protein
VDFDTFYSAQQLLTDTQEQLRALPTSNAARYAALLQGLNEKEVRVTCRRDDLAIVKAAVDALKKDAELAEFSISVKETTFLPATWSVPLSCIVAAGSLYLCD